MRPHRFGGLAQERRRPPRRGDTRLGQRALDTAAGRPRRSSAPRCAPARRGSLPISSSSRFRERRRERVRVGRQQDARIGVRAREEHGAVDRDDRLARARRARHASRPTVVALDDLALRRMEEDDPALPRVVERPLELLDFRHDAEPPLGVGMLVGIDVVSGDRIPAVGRPSRARAGPPPPLRAGDRRGREVHSHSRRRESELVTHERGNRREADRSERGRRLTGNGENDLAAKPRPSRNYHHGRSARPPWSHCAAQAVTEQAATAPGIRKTSSHAPRREDARAKDHRWRVKANGCEYGISVADATIPPTLRGRLRHSAGASSAYVR